MIEIQSFILCHQISDRQGGVATLHQAAIYNLYPTDGQWPLSCAPAFYSLLRKDSRASEFAFSLFLRCFDADGRLLVPPGEGAMRGLFPSGYRFWGITGMLRLQFPRAGDYALHLALQSDGGVSTYRYDIETIEQPRLVFNPHPLPNYP